MDSLRIVHFESLTALRGAAESWDDLWQQSDATLPTLRAKLIVQWVEHFAKAEDFYALAVESAGRLLAVAGLPIGVYPRWRSH